MSLQFVYYEGGVHWYFDPERFKPVSDTPEEKPPELLGIRVRVADWMPKDKIALMSVDRDGNPTGAIVSNIGKDEPCE